VESVTTVQDDRRWRRVDNEDEEEQWKGKDELK
jgi:hypothetical protein